MSWPRRTRLFLVGLALVLSSFRLPAQTPDVQKQVAKALAAMRQQPPVPPLPKAPSTASVTLPTDLASRQKLEAARDYANARDWGEAARLLQTVLDARDRTFFKKTIAAGTPAESVLWLSAPGEAERLLGSLPPQVREAYQALYGGLARRLLDEGLARRDLNTLSEVVRRYRFTSAGTAALVALGTHHLNQGSSELAVLYFRRLLQHPGLDRLAPADQFKAALAFRGGNDRAALAVARKALAARADKGLPFGDKVVTADELHRQIERWPHAGPRPDDWPLWRGDPTRTAPALGDLPLLEPRVSRSTDKDPAGLWLRRALDSVPEDALPLPAGVPLAVDGKVIYRGPAGLQALDGLTGRTLWSAALPLSLESILADPARKVQLERWYHMYRGAASLLFQNSTVATLSSDGRHVYAIDDLPLPLPPHPTHILEMEEGKKHYFSTLKDAIYHNQLYAVEVDTGRVAWVLGGRLTSSLPSGERGRG